jgi:hypothetical protein
MRKLFILAAAVVACSKQEAPPADTTPAAPPPPAAPAALKPADIAGTWNGTGKREGTDSSVAFTFMSTSDSTGKITFAGSKEATVFTTKFDADSVVSMSAAYKDPTMPKNAPRVMFRSVSRLKDGKMVGVASIVLASKPDSVLARTNWEATKAP